MADFYCEEVFSGKTKVETVLETDHVLAFHHTKPAYPLHIVIVPKQHITQLVDVVDFSIVEKVFEVAVQIIQTLQLHTKNYRTIINGGDFQDSKHLHFHLISQ